MKCSTPGCKNKRRKNRTKCSTCESKLNRKNNPVVTSYHSLKSSAKRRGIEFGITMIEWRKFCRENNYIELRGRGPQDLTVDRIDPSVGYFYFNMRAITHYENDVKAAEDKKQMQAERDKWLSKFIDPLEQKLIEAMDQAKKPIDYTSEVPPF